MHDLIVVGAGIAGLACAQRASASGMKTLVIERARSVGGRCATRRVEGQPFDHGLSYLHGSSPEFLAALQHVDATALPDWPRSIRGSGAPCQPVAVLPGDRRLGFAEGVSAFPRHLARGLDVRLRTRAVALQLDGDHPALYLEDGTRIDARSIALTQPCEPAAAMLGSARSQDPAVAALAQLLAMIGTRPCYTVIAAYPAEGPAPSWELWYPEDSAIVHVLSHDSSKREAPRLRVLVIQGHARWSRARRDVEPLHWAAELLVEAARLAGDWVRQPLWMRTHRWRHARVDRDAELTGPAAVRLGGGGVLALAGELFHPGGGAQAAYLSGRALGSRLVAEGAS